MPLFEYLCPDCGHKKERLTFGGQIEFSICPCGARMARVPSASAIIIAGNMGPKLRTRVNLDDELKVQGFNAPLFRSEELKDKVRWRLKKEGVN